MNTTPWGRKETLITPPRAPIYTYAAITTAVLLTMISAYLWTVLAWSRLERFYLPIYIESGVLGVVQKTHSYRLPTVMDAEHRARPALPEDVEPGQTSQPDGRRLPIQLTAAARAEGLETITRGEKIAHIETSPSMPSCRSSFMAAGALQVSLFGPVCSALFVSSSSFLLQYAKTLTAFANASMDDS